MTVVVRARIEAQEPGLIGRESERAALQLVLGRDGPAVVFVHGIGGVGKSALLETFMSDARAQGAVVVSLDGGAVEPTPRGFLAALSSATGGDLESAEDAVARLARLGSLVVLTVDRYEVLRPIDLWLQQDCRAGPAGERAAGGRGPGAADGGLADGAGPAVPRPPAGQPAARRGRGPPAPGRRHRRRHRAHQLAGARPSPVAPDGGGRARRPAGPRPRLDHGHRDRGRAHRAVPGRARSGDPRGPRCGVGRPPAHDLAARGDAPRCRAAGRLRPASRPPVRRSDQRRARRPRHGPRGRRRVPPGLRPRSPAALPHRRVAPAAGRGRARLAPGDVALHRRPAVHPPEPDDPRGVLPHDGAPLLRRGRTARRLAGDRGAGGRRRRRRRPSRSCRSGGGATRSGSAWRATATARSRAATWSASWTG